MSAASSSFAFYEAEEATPSSCLESGGESGARSEVSLVRESKEFPRHKFACESGRSTEFINVRQELYDSERAYLIYLQTLIQVYVEPLTGNERMLTKLDCRLLFADLRAIFALNSEILRSFRECDDIFATLATITPFLKLYSSYASNYAKCQHAVIHAISHGRFREFFDQQQSDPRSGGASFAALLIMPIQRVPRYMMLLKRLYRSTDSASELSTLKTVLSQITEIAGMSEACIADYENIVKLITIQGMIDVPGGLLEPGRRFVYEVALFQRQTVGESVYRERMFWLFSDILVCGKKKASVIPGTAKYEMKYRFPLRHCTLGYDQFDGSLQIGCKHEHLVLTADNYDVLSQWFDILKEAIDRASRLRATLRKESSRLPLTAKTTNLRKELTRKFVKMTYQYGVSVPMAATGCAPRTKSQSSDDSDSGMASLLGRSMGQQGSSLHSPPPSPSRHAPLGKRRARTDFDRELDSVVRKRLGVGGEEVERTEDRGPPPSAMAASSTPLSSKKKKAPAPPRPLPSSAAAGATPSGDHHHQRVLMRAETLTHPEIRKLSYQETPIIRFDSSSSRGSDSDGTPRAPSPVLLRKSETNQLRSKEEARNGGGGGGGSVPWWVQEAQPAEYVRGEDGGVLARVTRSITSRCSVM